MVRKICVVLLGSFLIQLCYACGSCFMEDTKSAPYYEVKDYTSHTSRITGLNEHSNFEFESLPENESVDFDKLAISVQASVEYYSEARPLPFSYTSAFACDPPPPGYKGTNQLLDSLVITSNYDFDPEHPKGTKLNEFFDRYTGQRAPLIEYLKQESLQAPEGLDLLLNTMPTGSSTQEFTFTFYLSSGQVYSTETMSIQLQ